MADNVLTPPEAPQAFVLTEDLSLSLKLQDTGGEVKASGDRKLASFKNTNMDIGVTCINEVHGYMDGEGSASASLFVLRFELGSRATGRRFKAFKPLLTFHSHPRGKRLAEEPYVEDLIHPGIQPLNICEFTSKRSAERTFKAAINLAPPDPIPAKGSIEWARTSTEEWTETYRYTVGAGRSMEKWGTGEERYDQLYWNAQQGKLIRTGIHVLQVAFVLQRTEGYDIDVKFNLEADVDFRYSVGRGCKKILGLPGAEREALIEIYATDPDTKERKKDPTTGRWRIRQTKVPEGVEPNFLRKLEGESRAAFEKLAWVEEKGTEPRRLYSNSEFLC
jgi:hypothetical protein